MQKKYRDMDARERAFMDSVRNGWYLSGFYEVTFEGHRRVFFADSLRWLASEAFRWFEGHARNHAGDRVLVRMLAAA